MRSRGIFQTIFHEDSATDKIKKTKHARKCELTSFKLSE